MQNCKNIIFASHNKGKISEIREILSPLGINVLSGEDLNLPDVEETGKTFEENAYIKALAAAKEQNIPCFADDSGLCVDAMGGRPGVYTARYAPNRDLIKEWTSFWMNWPKPSPATEPHIFRALLF